ncbi:MAG: TolC family protein, partial [Aquaspirillum sp.]
MIQRAQQHNQDIARALARLDEASAGLTSARADQLPQLGVNGQYQRARLSSVGSNTSLDRGEKV